MLELIDIHLGVAALPGVQDLQVRPVMLGQHGAVLLLECPELGSTFGIGLEIGLDSRTDLGRDV